MSYDNTRGNFISRLHIGYVITAVATFVVLMFLVGAVSGTTFGSETSHTKATTPINEKSETPAPSETQEDDLGSILSNVDVTYATMLRDELDGLESLTDEQIVNVARNACNDLQDGEDVGIILLTIDETIANDYNSAYVLYTGVATYCRSYIPTLEEYRDSASNTEEEPEKVREQATALEAGYLEYIKTHSQVRVIETDAELIELGYDICGYMENGEDFMKILNDVDVQGYSDPEVISIAAVGYLCPMYVDDAEDSIADSTQYEGIPV